MDLDELSHPGHEKMSARASAQERLLRSVYSGASTQERLDVGDPLPLPTATAAIPSSGSVHEFGSQLSWMCCRSCWLNDNGLLRGNAVSDSHQVPH